MYGLAARFVAITVALAIGASYHGAASCQPNDPTTLKVNAAAMDALAFYKIAGLSIAIGKGDKVVFTHAYGVRDRADGSAVDPGTWFAIASVSKQFTAAAIMLLLRDKKIALDLPVSNYWPQAPYATQITVRELLNQTSGLRDYLPPNIESAASEAKKYATKTIEQLLEPISKKGLLFRPGTRFAYSNTNYLVLSKLVQIVSQMSYADFVRTRILQPLGLDEISPELPRSLNVAKGYFTSDRSTAPVDPWPSSALQGAAAFYATPRGLVRWNQALYGYKLLGPSELKLMETPPLSVSGSNYGSGLRAGTLSGRRNFWHTGSLPGYNAYNTFFPDDGLSIVVLTNTAPFRSRPLVRQLEALADATVTKAALPTPTTAPNEDVAMTTRARKEFLAFQVGTVDLSRYSFVMAQALAPRQIAIRSHELSSLGEVQSFVFIRKIKLGEFKIYLYTAICVEGAESMTFAIDSEDKIDSIYFNPL